MVFLHLFVFKQKYRIKTVKLVCFLFVCLLCRIPDYFFHVTQVII